MQMHEALALALALALELALALALAWTTGGDFNSSPSCPTLTSKPKRHLKAQTDL